MFFILAILGNAYRLTASGEETLVFMQNHEIVVYSSAQDFYLQSFLTSREQPGV
jgi:hypothetical protein